MGLVLQSLGTNGGEAEGGRTCRSSYWLGVDRTAPRMGPYELMSEGRPLRGRPSYSGAGEGEVELASEGLLYVGGMPATEL